MDRAAGGSHLRHLYAASDHSFLGLSIDDGGRFRIKPGDHHLWAVRLACRLSLLCMVLKSRATMDQPLAFAFNSRCRFYLFGKFSISAASHTTTARDLSSDGNTGA